MLPTLKDKTRYLAYEATSATPVRKEDVEMAITEALMRLSGGLGLAKAGVQFLPDWKIQRGILRVSHTSVTEMKAALTLIGKVKSTTATVASRGVSGVLNKARSKFL